MAVLLHLSPCSSSFYHPHLQLGFLVQETTQVYEPLGPPAPKGKRSNANLDEHQLQSRTHAWLL